MIMCSQPVIALVLVFHGPWWCWWWVWDRGHRSTSISWLRNIQELLQEQARMQQPVLLDVLVLKLQKPALVLLDCLLLSIKHKPSLFSLQLSFGVLCEMNVGLILACMHGSSSEVQQLGHRVWKMDWRATATDAQSSSNINAARSSRKWCEWKSVALTCWWEYEALWANVPSQGSCCKIRCFPHCVRHVENTSWENMLHVDGWFSTIPTPQGTSQYLLINIIYIHIIAPTQFTNSNS